MSQWVNGGKLHGKILRDDADFTLLKTEPLGIPHWLIGNLYVLQKWSGQVRKATWFEKTFFVATIGELIKLGVHMPSEIHQTFFRGYSEAVLSRGDATWQLFFKHQTPAQAAATAARR